MGKRRRDNRKRLQITVDPETYTKFKALIPHSIQSLLVGKLLKSMISHLENSENTIDAFVGAALEDRVVVEITRVIPRSEIRPKV